MGWLGPVTISRHRTRPGPGQAWSPMSVSCVTPPQCHWRRQHYLITSSRRLQSPSRGAFITLTMGPWLSAQTLHDCGYFHLHLITNISGVKAPVSDCVSRRVPQAVRAGMTPRLDEQRLVAGLMSWDRYPPRPSHQPLAFELSIINKSNNCITITRLRLHAHCSLIRAVPNAQYFSSVPLLTPIYLTTNISVDNKRWAKTSWAQGPCVLAPPAPHNGPSNTFLCWQSNIQASNPFMFYLYVVCHKNWSNNIL